MYTLIDLRKWASSIGKFASIDNIEIIEGDISGQGGEDNVDTDRFGRISFRIYTTENRYNITAKCLHMSPDQTYLGCIASSRKPRAGEYWTRGNDLADGELSLETWNKILSDIVSYEMVKIHKTVRGTADEG